MNPLPKERAAPSANQGRPNAQDTRSDSVQTTKFKCPFIPAWLDDAALSQAEFRLYCHLCRRAGRDGIAWTNAETISKVCRVSRNTVWPAIENLESKHHLIKRLGKPFGRANRYQVLVPIEPNETPIEIPSTGPNGAPIETLSIGPNETPPIGPNEGRQSDQMERHKGSPKKVLQRRVSNREKSNGHVSSDESIQFAVWFKSSLPESINLQSNWLQSFAKTYDDLVRIDRRKPEDIRQVCQWARTDGFWKVQFMSPGKLRKRNSDGITYFDLFSERMKQPSGQTAKPAATSTANTGDREKFRYETTIE